MSFKHKHHVELKWVKNVELNLVQKESYWPGGLPPRPKTQDQAQAHSHAQAHDASQAGQTVAARMESLHLSPSCLHTHNT